MTFEDVVNDIQEWIESIGDTIDNVNARHTDGVLLDTPREKDIIVTFMDDELSKPEQCPAVIIEIQGAGWSSPVVGSFHGAIGGSVYVIDEASSVEKTRKKLMRWVDALNTHCTAESSVLRCGRIVPKNCQFSMGKSAGNLNSFFLKLDFILSAVSN
jgi:hypothetical protein